MMHPTTPIGDIGVIVGRFQVHELHSGHVELIDSVAVRHQKLVILLGSTPGVLVTRNNPLDFQTRKAMIQEMFPQITVLPLRDQPTDEGWSADLDHVLTQAFEIGSCVLYGSRDGFAPSYSGKWPVVELEATQRTSGTEIRNSLSHSIRASRDFRHGVVYAAHNRHPVTFPTVDIALIKVEGPAFFKDVALCRQPTDPPGMWRFPGGFVDPTDESLEAAAARELHEELGQCPGVALFEYVGSHRQDAWRYRKEVDSITTTLFTAPYQMGALCPSDDVVSAEWFPVPCCAEDHDILVPEHRALGAMLIAYLEKKQS